MISPRIILENFKKFQDFILEIVSHEIILEFPRLILEKKGMVRTFQCNMEISIWGSNVLRGCVVGTTCVYECTLYRPIVIQPLRHRAGSRTDCETGGASQPIENTLTRDFSLCWRLSLRWIGNFPQMYNRGNMKFSFRHTYCNMVLGLTQTSCTFDKPPNSQSECSLVCSLHLTDFS